MPRAGVDTPRACDIIGGMSETDKDLEKDMPEGTSCDDPCNCGQQDTPEQEYADAVDESAEGEAEAAVDELQKWRDMAMRTAAEYDNYRKRCVKDREEFTRYATRGLLEELLPVARCLWNGNEDGPSGLPLHALHRHEHGTEAAQ